MREYFLVVIDFSFVAKDVVTTLERSRLGVPLVAKSEDHALELLGALDPEAAVRLAVLQARHDSFEAGRLRTVLDAHGAHVVLIEGEESASDEPSPYPVLRMPFFSEDLEQIVTGLGPQSQ